MKNSKRGTYIIEAAVVLPIIIIAMITLVLIEGYYYQLAAETGRMHIALRGNAGALTGKTIYADGGNWKGEIDMKKSAIGGKVYGRGEVRMVSKGMIMGKGSQTIEGSYYAVDGPKYVRYCSMVKGVLTDEEQ